MFANHTPGPWHVADNQVRGSAHPGSPAPHETVATLAPVRRQQVGPAGDHTLFHDHDVEHANAALIAAAPDLLAALIDLRQAVEQAVDRGLLEEAPLDPRTALDAQVWMSERLGPAIRQAREAITHATGKRPGHRK